MSVLSCNHSLWNWICALGDDPKHFIAIFQINVLWQLYNQFWECCKYFFYKNEWQVLLIYILSLLKEPALVYQFTMLELMYYFGILYGMNLKYTRRRTDFLKEFLNLPTIHRICGHLRYYCVYVFVCETVRMCVCMHAVFRTWVW